MSDGREPANITATTYNGDGEWLAYRKEFSQELRTLVAATIETSDQAGKLAFGVDGFPQVAIDGDRGAFSMVQTQADRATVFAQVLSGQSTAMKMMEIIKEPRGMHSVRGSNFDTSDLMPVRFNALPLGNRVFLLPLLHRQGLFTILSAQAFDDRGWIVGPIFPQQALPHTNEATLKDLRDSKFGSSSFFITDLDGDGQRLGMAVWQESAIDVHLYEIDMKAGKFSSSRHILLGPLPDGSGCGASWTK